MSVYLCKKCGTAFMKDFEVCPIIGCGGELFECDEFMYPTIQLLNAKNYKTLFCCSGHINETVPDIYIDFDPSIKKHLSDNDSFYKKLPANFTVEHEAPPLYDDLPRPQICLTVRHIIEPAYINNTTKLNLPDKMRLIASVNASLYKWAANLHTLIISEEDENES